MRSSDELTLSARIAICAAEALALAAWIMVIILWWAATPAHSEENNWHLMTTSYGGHVSLLHGMDEKTCKFSRARALRIPATPEEAKAERDRYAAANPPCPEHGVEKSTKEEWAQWHKDHYLAEGCQGAPSQTSMSWGGGRMISDSDIRTAECFQ